MNTALPSSYSFWGSRGPGRKHLRSPRQSESPAHGPCPLLSLPLCLLLTIPSPTQARAPPWSPKERECFCLSFFNLATARGRDPSTPQQMRKLRCGTEPSLLEVIQRDATEPVEVLHHGVECSVNLTRARNRAGKCVCRLWGRESEEISWGHGSTQETLFWWVRDTVDRVPGQEVCQLRHEDWHSSPLPQWVGVQLTDLGTQLQPLEGTVPS